MHIGDGIAGAFHQVAGALFRLVQHEFAAAQGTAVLQIAHLPFDDMFKPFYLAFTNHITDAGL